MSNTLQGAKQRFGIIGRSPLLDQALNKALRVASTDLTVLISGESGVGKEVFSKLIHSQSARKHGNFIAVNCGAIPPGTINSELFGHEKGAFTGATADRKGYFETVNGGTIFLDEIGEMPLDTQSYLLRVLESGEYLKVGASQVMKTDVRVIAATNKDLEKRVYEGKFRDDLYYRLSTVEINVPALTERREDVPILFRKFAADFAESYRAQAKRLEEDAQILLSQYSWPGNIRELKNVAQQVSVLSDKDRLDAEDLARIYPKLAQRNLPSIAHRDADSGMAEREILYKLLFDMKSDLNDLKSVVYEMIRNNDSELDKAEVLSQLNNIGKTRTVGTKLSRDITPMYTADTEDDIIERNVPIILSKAEEEAYEQSQVVEESLKLEEMEKEMIKKALERHRGRRREAADDLGISERTLYRKIKQYDIAL